MYFKFYDKNTRTRVNCCAISYNREEYIEDFHQAYTCSDLKLEALDQPINGQYLSYYIETRG